MMKNFKILLLISVFLFVVAVFVQGEITEEDDESKEEPPITVIPTFAPDVTYAFGDIHKIPTEEELQEEEKEEEKEEKEEDKTEDKEVEPELQFPNPNF